MCETSSRYIDDGAARRKGYEGRIEGELKGMRSANEENERAKEKEEKRPLNGEAGQNNGIVTRLWIGASMKPMVCKTPRESA